MESNTPAPWFQHAADFAGRKITNAEQLQGLALLAVAEAIHRLAAAVEVRNTYRPRG